GVSPCLALVAGELNMFGATVWGAPASGSAISVDGTSTLWINGGAAGGFSSASPIIGATIATGGRIISGGTTWRGNAGGKAVANSGTMIDAGGNDWKTCTGASCTVKTPGQVVSGKQPVRK
ncbi:MAG TPA: hypothetical protein VMS92_22860, partial [Mycobacterium sp.]|nr:hypothetical protein [Mycobacterium sp.]